MGNISFSGFHCTNSIFNVVAHQSSLLWYQNYYFKCFCFHFNPDKIKKYAKSWKAILYILLVNYVGSCSKELFKHNITQYLYHWSLSLDWINWLSIVDYWFTNRQMVLHQRHDSSSFYFQKKFDLHSLLGFIFVPMRTLLLP